jgi:hypothetical protein
VGLARKIQPKNHAPNSKIQNYYFSGSTISQFFTGARSHYQEQLLQQTLKNLLRIAHRNSNNVAVSKTSKNFMAQDKHQ